MAKVGLFDRELAPDEWFDADADLELTVEYVETGGDLPERTGTGATTAAARTQSAAGAVLVSASCTASSPAQVQGSAAGVAVAATGVSSAGAQSQAAQGDALDSGTGATVAPAQGQAAAAAAGVRATGSTVAPGQSASGSATRSSTPAHSGGGARGAPYRRVERPAIGARSHGTAAAQVSAGLASAKQGAKGRSLAPAQSTALQAVVHRPRPEHSDRYGQRENARRELQRAARARRRRDRVRGPA